MKHALAAISAGAFLIGCATMDDASSMRADPPGEVEFDPESVPYVYDPGDYDTAWEHYQARLAEAGGGDQHTDRTIPDWSGVWQNAPGSGFSLRPGEEFAGRGFSTVTTMQLTPLFAAEHEMRIRQAEAGNDFDPITWCLPSGFPRWMVEPFLKEFVAAPDRTLLMNEMNNETRRIYTDGRGHISEDYAFPMWFGDSIGFWDGDTLVIHTNNIKSNLLQREQPALSNSAETVEEWTEIRDGVMEVKVTVYDPEALLAPHSAIRYYTTIDDQEGDLRVLHWSCTENQPVVRTPEGGSDFAILPSNENYLDLTDPESWLMFEEARDAGLVDEFEERAASGGDE